MKFSTATEGRKEATALYRAVCTLREQLSRHELLTGPLETELKELLNRLTDFVCPYSVKELDKRVKEQDEKYPDWEHGYLRCGTTVTWLDRPRSAEHPLWDLYPHTRELPGSAASRHRARAGSPKKTTATDGKETRV